MRALWIITAAAVIRFFSSLRLKLAPFMMTYVQDVKVHTHIRLMRPFLLITVDIG